MGLCYSRDDVQKQVQGRSRPEKLINVTKIKVDSIFKFQACAIISMMTVLEFHRVKLF